jgi:transcriptional regulator with GAF, ATPase, and Fis domain
MAAYDWQIVLPVVSLCALVVVYHFREWMKAEDAESYRNIVVGLTVLSLANLAPLYASDGVFALVPFLNEPLFFSLVMWIAALTGLIFLSSGVAGFLPLAREHRLYNQKVIARLELLKEVEQLVGVETRPEAILCGIINRIANAYPLRAGAVFTWSENTHTLKHLASVNKPPIPTTFLEALSLDSERFARDPRHVLLKAATANGKLTAYDLPALILPVASNSTLYGTLLLWWHKGQPADDPSRMLLKLAAEIAARRIEANHSQDRVYCSGDYCRIASTISQLFSPETSVRSAFAAIARVLNHVLDSRTVTMIIKANDGSWHRLTGGPWEAVLYEKRVKYREISAIARQVMADGTPVYHRSCHSADLVRTGDGVHKGSLMALPIIRNEKTVGVVSLLSDRESAFDRHNIRLLVQTITSLGELSWLLGKEKVRDTAQRRQQLLRAFVRDAYRELSTQRIFEDVTRVVARGIEADIVRVSTFDRARRFLNSRGLVCRREPTTVPPKRASLLLDLLPVHRRLLDGQRTIVLDRNHGQPAMDDSEMLHMFGHSISSAMLVPVLHEDDIVGVVSVGRCQAGQFPEFSDADMTFIELVTAAASLAIRQARLDRKLLNRRSVPTLTPDMRSRVKSSLSGIVGSIEMIRAHGQSSDEPIEKYLEIIDRSARRLSETVEEPARQS